MAPKRSDRSHPRIQLLKEMRQPIADTNKRRRRVDYEYERAGTASIFMFCEPLFGWRRVSLRDRRTKVDWAQEVGELLRTRYASAAKVILVCDNLNTHIKGAFYKAFDVEKARSLVRRLEFCRTPKHGSWLNIAENELSSMTRQCITSHRFATVDELPSFQDRVCMSGSFLHSAMLVQKFSVTSLPWFVLSPSTEMIFKKAS
jgi:hypothetical protein